MTFQNEFLEILICGVSHRFCYVFIIFFIFYQFLQFVLGKLKNDGFSHAHACLLMFMALSEEVRCLKKVFTPHKFLSLTFHSKLRILGFFNNISRSPKIWNFKERSNLEIWRVWRLFGGSVHGAKREPPPSSWFSEVLYLILGLFVHLACPSDCAELKTGVTRISNNVFLRIRWNKLYQM